MYVGVTMDLTDEQWSVIEKGLPHHKIRSDGRGRPATDPRSLIKGILWILRTGAPWRELPDRYPPYQTVHRWFQRWVNEGVIERLLHHVSSELLEAGKIDLS